MKHPQIEPFGDIKVIKMAAISSLLSRDPRGLHLRHLHLDRYGRSGLFGHRQDRTRRLRDQRPRHVDHLRLRRHRQHSVSVMCSQRDGRRPRVAGVKWRLINDAFWTFLKLLI